MKGKKYDGSVNYNALCNFWRSVENLTTTANSTMWAVSQATSMRRMNIKNHNTNREKTVMRKQLRIAVFIAVLVGIVLMVFQYFRFVSKTIMRKVFLI